MHGRKEAGKRWGAFSIIHVTGPVFNGSRGRTIGRQTASQKGLIGVYFSAASQPMAKSSVQHELGASSLDIPPRDN